jgi:Abortive infection alpha
MVIEKNLEKFRLNLEGVPAPEIIPVRPEVGVPILEKLMYVGDDELSDLYINLLSKASIVQTAKFVHPSFVSIVDNLSPDEAVILTWKGFRCTVPNCPDRSTKYITEYVRRCCGHPHWFGR